MGVARAPTAVDLDQDWHRPWFAGRLQATLDAIFASALPTDLLLLASDVAREVQAGGGGDTDQIRQAAGVVILRTLGPALAVAGDPARKMSVLVQKLGTGHLTQNLPWVRQAGDPIFDTFTNNRNRMDAWLAPLVLQQGAQAQGGRAQGNRRHGMRLG